MKYVESTPRNQIHLYSQCIDEMVGADNPVRFVDLYVDELDLEKLGFCVVDNATGRPPFDPRMMIKLYMYGYLQRIRTSRRLERECERNIELIWLTGDLRPDFHTIAEFRRINHKAMRALFREFLSFCRKLNLLKLETVGIDGTKVRAQNNVSKVFRRNTIEEVVHKIDEKIEEYLKELDENDEREETLELDREKVARRIEQLRRKRDTVGGVQRRFAEDSNLEIVCATDEDARLMNDKGKIRPGYNVQAVVDAEHKLIVAVEVTNEANDKHQMEPMLTAVSELKREMKVETKTSAEMDCGYHREEAVLKYKDSEEFDLVVPSPKDSPKPQSETSVPQKEYRAEAFYYDKEKDEFRCPEGKPLPLLTMTTIESRRAKLYRGECCGECAQREKCTRNAQGRTITISENHWHMEAFRDKMNTPYYRKKINERKELCEHPFGTLKRGFGYDHFLLRGVEKVRSEFSFMCFIYNLRRSLSLVGVGGLLMALNG